MGNSPRCLFESDIYSFLIKDKDSVFGILCERYHGDALTTTREAWIREIEILQEALMPWKESDGHIVLEYDIPRLGKRLDAVLLLKGIIGSGFITSVELIFGIIFNIFLKKDVWDYSDKPLNIGGQVCALYSFFWTILSIIFIPLADKLNMAFSKR